MPFDTTSSSLRAKSLQSKRIKHSHPAFEDSDSEDEDGMTKAIQFQLLLRQDAQRQDLNTSPLSSTPGSTHSKLLHAIESPFRLLPKPHLPKHLPHFRHETKPQFLIVSEPEAPSPDPSTTEPLRPRPSPSTVVSATQLPPPLPPPLFPPPSPPRSPGAISPPRVRPRRNTLAEATPEYSTTTLASTETLRSRRYRSFDFEAPNIAKEQPLPSGETPQVQSNKPIPNPSHASSLWSRSSASTRVMSVQDIWKSTFAPSIRDSIATPLSPPIPGFVDAPLGLARFERPKLELRTVDLLQSPPSQRSAETPRSAVRRREKLKKPSATRNIQISAPASLETATDLVDFQIAPPRTPPLPPKPTPSQSGTLDGSTILPTGGTVIYEEKRTSGGSSSDTMRTDATKPNEPTKKIPKFSVVAKVAGRLLRPPSPQRTSSLNPARPALPPLLYSSSTPIEKHIVAVSTRVKEEFKMKLKNKVDLPLVDAATEEELVLQLQDVNEDVARCAKEVAKLLQRSGASSVVDKRESKSVKAKKALDIHIRTSLNSFLVARVFQPFSIRLSPEDDEAVRQRYEEIAPSVPQFVASRWRVVASVSTSRPVQELGPVLVGLAAEVTAEILGERATEAELARETAALLTPLVRHAYLLAHFNHLEMVTADYDIFLGTELGGWIIHSQEEEKQHNRHSKSQARDSRVSGYWALGLRKKRYVGEGTFQRRVWDVLLKSQVLASTVA